MSPMFVKLGLLLCMSNLFGILNGKTPNQRNPHQYHETDLETFVYQKIEGIERLLVEKDKRIEHLESKIANLNTELTELEERTVTLEREGLHKDRMVNRLQNRIIDLETMMMGNILKKSESPPQNVMYKTITSLKKQNLQSPITANETRESLLRQDSWPEPQSRYEIQNDSPVSEPSTDQSENFAEDLSRTITQRTLKKRVDPAYSKIAFHVALSKDTTYHTDNTIVYDNVKLDHGNGYSPGDGIYIIPTTGTYIFTWTSLCLPHNYFQTILVVNGAYQGSSFTNSDEINDVHQSTTVNILSLNQGDHVFIRMGFSNGQGTFVSRLTVGESTFSGWKLD